MTSIDPRILYWTRDEDICNFGDYLSDFYARKILMAPLCQVDAYRLIGSAIDNDLIERDLSTLPTNARIAYWCCGMRKTQIIRREFVDRCDFFGVRGPLSRDLLELGANAVLGDPGLLLPLMIKPYATQTSGKTICIPHFSQLSKIQDVGLTGADMLISPAVANDQDLIELVNAIASADFVLTGALHGAIAACAYGRPFAFWDSGFIDIPFKWDDFAASIGIKAAFVADVAEGRAYYDAFRQMIRPPELSPILGCCPFAVRPSFMLAALAKDAGANPQVLAPLLKKTAQLTCETSDFILKIRTREREIYKKRQSQAQKERRDCRRYALKELEKFNDRFKRTANDFEQRLAILSMTLGPHQAEIKFARHELGAALLEGDWAPPNEIAPWSLPPSAIMRIPAGSGWEEARALIFDGYIFAPLVAPINGKRHVKIWLNSTLVWDKIFENTSSTNHGPRTRFHLRIPEQVRSCGADLIINFSLEEIGSNKELGIMHDDRKIGFAPLSATFVFE